MIKLRKATGEDIEQLAGIFWSELAANPGYISHGELQAGIAAAPALPAAGGLEKWKQYIARAIAGPRRGVLLHEQGGEIAGFVVLEVAVDGDKPFGTVCDLVVRPAWRERGIGTALLAAGMAWLGEQGVDAFYLESGIHNPRAHAFFEHHGFRIVSHVFKWEAPPA
jgi:ribosomal protein S18 acetylase RimI-like enzyme